MNARIRDYLEKVLAGRAINFVGFRKALIRQSISEFEIDRMFSVELLGKNQYQVNVIDSDRFDRLLRRFSAADAGTRIEAAVQGDSHQVAASGSCVLLRSADQPHPVVVLFDQNTFNCPVPPGEILLLVENLENFLKFSETLSLLSGWLDEDTLPWQMVFSAGNQISNRLHEGFLDGFRRLYCLFDLDPGGLKTYRSLRQLLPNRSVEFILPDRLETRLAESTWRLAPEERQELLRYTDITPEIDSLVELMRRTGRKLEQETYLYPL